MNTHSPTSRRSFIKAALALLGGLILAWRKKETGASVVEAYFPKPTWPTELRPQRQARTYRAP